MYLLQVLIGSLHCVHVICVWPERFIQFVFRNNKLKPALNNSLFQNILMPPQTNLGMSGAQWGYHCELKALVSEI